MEEQIFEVGFLGGKIENRQPGRADGVEKLTDRGLMGAVLDNQPPGMMQGDRIRC